MLPGGPPRRPSARLGRPASRQSVPLASGLRGGAAASTAVEALAPRLLPLALDGLTTERPLSVLDVGAATPASVRFFGRFHCRLHFADLFGETGFDSHRRNERRRPQETLFERVFDFPPSTMFDVCLFWDFLNYLGQPLLRDFASTLRPHVHDDTKAHAFAAFSNALPFSGLAYSIEEADRLRVRPAPQQATTPHTRKILGETLWPFAVRRAALLEANRQELLLEVRRI